jgi:SNF2 family DNA or RNA helicase
MQAAWIAHEAPDITDYEVPACWNDRVCLQHRQSSGSCPLCGSGRSPHLCPLCDYCGVMLRRHQRTGSMWLFLAGDALLADTVGLGKTPSVTGMLAFCRESGELSLQNRAVVVAKSSAVGQWATQLTRMIPSLRVIATTGSMSKQQRINAYLTPWEVAVISERTLASARGAKRSKEGDLTYLSHFPVGIVVADDTDAMRTRTTRTSHAVRELAGRASRVVIVHGTPLQKKMDELYNFLEPIGGPARLGSQRQFHYRYVTTSTDVYYTRDSTGQVVECERTTDTGVKNEQELQQLIAPLILRRRPEHVDDMTLPAIQPNVVWLDPSPAQARRYAELQDGVLRLIREQGETISRPQAAALWTHGWQICSGLATLDEGPGDDSIKLDWIMEHVEPPGAMSLGGFAGDKAVVFVNFKPNVEALSRRLDVAGIRHVVMWGNETGQAERDRRLTAFRQDPGCRMLIGTTTIEMSLNLQAARHLIAVDTIPNPARMTQPAGRVRRAGSPFSTVYFHQLLLRGTQEEGILNQLYSEQETADTVWGEQGDLFQDRTPLEMLRMIAARRAA